MHLPRQRPVLKPTPHNKCALVAGRVLAQCLKRLHAPQHRSSRQPIRSQADLILLCHLSILHLVPLSILRRQILPRLHKRLRRLVLCVHLRLHSLVFCLLHLPRALLRSSLALQPLLHHPTPPVPPLQRHLHGRLHRHLRRNKQCTPVAVRFSSSRNHLTSHKSTRLIGRAQKLLKRLAHHNLWHA